MPEPKAAAIDVDEIGEKSLSSISAADFIGALNAGALGPLRLAWVPEKKKVELELEPGAFGKVRVRDFVRVVVEKKKVELEKDPRIEGYVGKNRASEVTIDPRDFISDPGFITQVAREVAAQLKGR